MLNFLRILLAAITILVSSQIALAQNVYPFGNAQDTLFINLRTGSVRIQLLPDVAPKHVEQIKKLVKQGFYDGIIFHRVIDEFMAQTGDPTGTGRGGSELPNIEAEFTTKYSFERGVVGMARSNHPNSANSQFFIMLDDGSFLDNNYTIWGRVVSGMDAVDNIAKGEPPANPDKMLEVYLLSNN